LIHRGRTEIIADILGALTQGEATTTEMMYGTYLTFDQASSYLRYMVERDLVSLDAGTKLYAITKKGAELLDISEGVANLVAIAPFDKIGASY